MAPKPIKHYTYFAQNAQGAIQQLPMQAFGPEKPTSEQIEALYQQVVAHHGLSVPRPTHFSATVLHELPLMVERSDQQKRPMILVPKNGADALKGTQDGE